MIERVQELSGLLGWPLTIYNYLLNIDPLINIVSPISSLNEKLFPSYIFKRKDKYIFKTNIPAWWSRPLDWVMEIKDEVKLIEN